MAELGSTVLGVLGVILELGEERRPEAEEAALRGLLPLLAVVAQSQSSTSLGEMAVSIQVCPSCLVIPHYPGRFLVRLGLEEES